MYSLHFYCTFSASVLALLDSALGHADYPTVVVPVSLSFAAVDVVVAVDSPLNTVFYLRLI